MRYRVKVKYYCEYERDLEIDAPNESTAEARAIQVVLRWTGTTDVTSAKVVGEGRNKYTG